MKHGYGKRVPVIFDTDIGGDIDDTWALTMLLKSPELDVKLAVSDTGNTTYRAKIIAKMLETAGRTDVPVGVGIHLSDDVGPQQEWVEDYQLASYKGRVYQDGVEAIVNAIMDSPRPVTLVCVGPVPNIKAAIEREPRIARKARFVGMHGCLRKSPWGYNGKEGGLIAEYNVRADAKALQKVFEASWPITITPLDTCGFVRLKGEKYRAVRDCSEPLVQALMENYRIWLKKRGDTQQFENQSTILFDTVAVYLAFSEELLEMQELGIRVTDDGYTLMDDKARRVNCAVEWKDLSAYEDFLVERLTGKKPD
ncbi:nucleoside hydrolase [Candidatus Bathyarchaeota archaeon]|nr:nucleoside hydrolase [Candidatus Bathyarchaeota archaeon]